MGIEAGLLGWAATLRSPTFDEPGHLAAGISHWRFGTFAAYAVNPPLVRSLAALPVLAARPVEDWGRLRDDPASRPETAMGRDFLAANGWRSFRLFTWARWACIPFSLLGGYVCYRWACDLYGIRAGLLALGLWCSCPNVLAHGPLITPDLGATALGLAASYLFWRWLKRPGWGPAIRAGAVLGLAELTKTTWLLLVPLWPLTWLAWSCPSRRGAAGPGRRLQAVQLGAILVLGLDVLNLGYGFDGSCRRLKDFPFVSRALGGPRPWNDASSQPRNRFAGRWLGELPVPLPKDYLLGIDVQKRDFENRPPSYLRGRWRVGGWWYYYLYGLAVKVPLGTWMLVLLAAGLGLARRGYALAWRDEMALLLTPAVVLAFVSAQAGFNHHLRYVLPSFPYAFIFAGRVARAIDLGHRAVVVLAALALLGSIGSSLRAYPHSLSYFNELAGGPGGGPAHLLDSNIDWGQDLLDLKRWLDRHPGARPLHLAYFGSFDPGVAGIAYTLPPSDPRPGWHAVSVNLLYGMEMPVPDGQGGWPMSRRTMFAWFRGFRPLARAGHSIYIYHVSPAEAEAARRAAGLPALPGPATGKVRHDGPG